MYSPLKASTMTEPPPKYIMTATILEHYLHRPQDVVVQGTIPLLYYRCSLPMTKAPATVTHSITWN
jgi:hypothetical protein